MCTRAMPGPGVWPGRVAQRHRPSTSSIKRSPVGLRRPRPHSFLRVSASLPPLPSNSRPPTGHSRERSASVTAMEGESSFDYVLNFVSTPSDGGYPFAASPSPDLPLVQPSHMNVDPPQSGFSSTPTDLELVESYLRPVVPAMEGETSFENFVSTPSDVGLPLPSPSSDRLLVQPSHTNMDPRQSAIAVAIQSWVPPDLSSTPTDLELLENYLRPVVRPSGFPEESQNDFLSRWRAPMDVAGNPVVVNASLPSMDPWELPGIKEAEQGRTEKYYLTNHHRLSFGSGDVETPNGIWLPKGPASVVRGNASTGRFSRDVAGYKKTYIWKWKDSNPLGEIKSNWIMNVYCLVNRNYVEHEMVLSHVFEASPDYDAKPACPTSGQGRCNGEHHNEEDIYISFRGSSPMRHGPFRSRHPELASYIAMFENILLGDPDPDPDSPIENECCSPRRGVSPTDDHGKSHKRKKISDVWDHFTKIYARDLQGNVVTLAACNHCSKVLTANSKNGTRHLRDHTCPCKFKPVQAGRKDKGVDNVPSSQASSLLPQRDVIS